MARHYKRKLGGRPYKYYDSGALKNAVGDVKAKKLTIRRAAEKYGIPKSTISDKLKNLHSLNPGRPPVFNIKEEEFLVKGIIKAAEWGFPFTTRDILQLVKIYLDNKGIREKRFVDNLPGRDWFKSFMARHKQLSVRLSENVKRARAEVDHRVINEYFDELQNSLRNVSPSHIVNYDETNFSDDPGRVKVITKRGSKHADRIIDSSKSSVSVMLAGSGSGVLLPPYIVYKAQHLYPTWIENGPAGAAYNRSKSGWFDQTIFEDWFRKIALPYFRNLQGKKILIGDILSSHISMDVIRECMVNDIQFILLPPNSTHLCQPLDVAFFRPLKITWRNVLNTWKINHKGVFPKSEFPKLLNDTLIKIGENAKKI